VYFIEIEETFVDVRIHGRTDGKLSPISLGRLPKFGSRPKMAWSGHIPIFISEALIIISLDLERLKVESSDFVAVSSVSMIRVTMYP